MSLSNLLDYFQTLAIYEECLQFRGRFDPGMVDGPSNKLGTIQKCVKTMEIVDTATERAQEYPNTSMLTLK